MIQKTTTIFLCLVLLSCSDNKKTDIPSNILSKQKMAEVLIDIHLLEATMSLNNYHPDMIPKGNPSPPFDVFKKHKITNKQYNESFEYYSLHPDLLKDVYQLVLDNLSKMQAQVMNKKEVVKVPKDTIKIDTHKIEKKIKRLKKKGK